MAGSTAVTRLSRIMMCLLTLAGLPIISALVAEGVARPAENHPPKVSHCEQYNTTQCSNEGPQPLLCSGKMTETCEVWNNPEKINQCFVVWTNNSGKVEITYKGCWLNDNTCSDECINDQPASSLTENKKHLFCCCNHNNCNHNFFWRPLPEVPSTTPTTPQDQDVVVKTVAWTLGTLICVVVIVTLLFYLYRRRKMANFMELPRVESAALVPPSPPLCVRPIQLREIKARGRFGAVWKANLHTDVVAVKIFPVQDKQSWLVEKEVYSLPQMSHENVLQFIGAEKHGDNYQAEFWLITAYHERGSLCDYLKANLVTWNDLCKIGESMARGLMYVHEEQPATKCESLKPSIAHRDFKSKNVLLKADLSACIADFGLALVFHPGQSAGDTHGQVGTRRYMAPEVLEGAINFQRDAFLRIDMYACGLVLWEILSRCSSQDGPVPEYHLPFEEEVGQHPTLDDMQECVVTQKTRPAIRDVWRKNAAMMALIDTMEECWDHDAEARLSASCVVERLAIYSKNLHLSPTSNPQKESSI
ncbi:activin receptor type-2A-like isoform X2 [Homarus americanus]|uniref:receptor protein serine/threonine kinase n=1 Tax=Homarus americanus TaxID=6706 RepID=A0A8J5JMA6_HOMAM|nr:activin receptor type-2A-like isoform X2 [Homarus americanus]XP_042239963.1 activin receptor type-2A-like isoform X2 [Homarus americanus]XP_042239964.1 activin receptor type-2A-like isoform X2 [Homarus americanus]XP_042239965.1 activin receptor type-2A-like isoform X2 [Homarus americanus]XP_042239966.1 activin receptor type-2A-like isoform X2 [Homarus americanus]XP_042239967.1 activin receptor type-2A-like isoform X2 [Homarus americanus]KAG7158928.1 Activin receptor type-2A-like [Homarus a